MTSVLVGPLLRHVGSTDATVWVETDGPCEVEILGHRERTWTVCGHHYALVTITGLQQGSTHTYDVRLDGDLSWPMPGDGYPAPRIRTIESTGQVRIAFGSCRFGTSAAVAGDRHFDPDALECFAHTLTTTPEADWPEALLLLGDQVYADETTAATRARIGQRRDITRGAKDQVADFEEYTWLYTESWTDPAVRWLLSTVPTSMIFDDHDVRDDWNTSASWRHDMQALDWWPERVIGALSSYWVYQHLGNLRPAELAQNELYQRVRALGSDAAPLLRQFAAAADREADGAKGARWSYRRDFGRVRLLVIDSRCGRILDDGSRSMISAAEFGWLVEQAAGDYDHLLIGTSLPWLLPRAVHDLESWNEQLCAGVRGRTVARWAEKLRRAADMEHWAAFRRSFDALADLIAAIGRGEHSESGTAPATVCVLSGDVHHAYIAQAHYREKVASQVFQLTCSPFHNYVPAAMKAAFRSSWSGAAEKATRRLLGLLAAVPPMSLSWSCESGPYFGNQLMTLIADGRAATVLLQKSDSRDNKPVLHDVRTVRLADSAASAPTT